MRIGILQTGHAPDSLEPAFGDYGAFFERMLAGHGFSFRTWSVVDMDFPDSPFEADGWLLTGSRHGAYEDLPFIRPLEEFIRAAYDAHVPLVGICFGHQIIAKALGGKVEKFTGGWSVGAQEYDFGGEKMVVNAWHQDQVTVKPPEAECIASSPFCANAALVYGDRALTVQAHPEYGHDFIDGLIRTRGPGVVPDALLAQARDRLGARLDSPRVADRIAEFFTQPRG